MSQVERPTPNAKGFTPSPWTGEGWGGGDDPRPAICCNDPLLPQTPRSIAASPPPYPKEWNASRQLPPGGRIYWCGGLIRGDSSLRLAFCVLLVAIGYQLAAISLAQSVTFGLDGRVAPDYLTPTLELSYPVQDITLGLRLQRDAFGVSAESALELGPVGRISYGGRGSLGFAGWGLGAFARGGAGPVAAEARLGYYSTPPANLWVGDYDPIQPVAAGFNGLLSGRYRLSSTQTVGLSAQYFGIFAAEGTFALCDQNTYTFGVGYQNGLYGLLGWRGEVAEDGSLLEVSLRAGFYNRLETLFITPLDDTNKLNLRFTVAYPWAAKLGIEVGNVRADAAFDGGWSLWLRYTLNFGGEE